MVIASQILSWSVLEELDQALWSSLNPRKWRRPAWQKVREWDVCSETLVWKNSTPCFAKALDDTKAVGTEGPDLRETLHLALVSRIQRTWHSKHKIVCAQRCRGH